MSKLPSEMFGWHSLPVGKHWKVHVYKPVPAFVEEILKPIYGDSAPRIDSMFLGPGYCEEPPGGWLIKWTVEPPKDKEDD